MVLSQKQIQKQSQKQSQKLSPKLNQKKYARTGAFAVSIWVVLLLSSCASSSGTNGRGADNIAHTSPAESISPFSLTASGDMLPSGWQHWIISRFNRKTQYKIVEQDGAKVLEAFAERSASGVLQEVSIEPARFPQLSWRWRVSDLPKEADITRRGSDDSPASVIVSFEGDKSKFDFEDRSKADMVKLFSGREMPYATLIYVWDNKLPVDSMLDNVHSGRAKMIVVESGAARVGKWLSFNRDVMEDFQRAFNEAPGKIISVGVMSDSNATNSVVTTHYGDIALASR